MMFGLVGSAIPDISATVFDVLTTIGFAAKLGQDL